MLSLAISGVFLLATLPFASPYSLQLPFDTLLQKGPTVSNTETKEFIWTDIQPSTDLIWHSCFDGFKCARLDVPLDWLEPSDDARVVVAIIKLPATDVENYKGAVFTNPGGPGGSGVYSLKRSGRALQKIVGANYDIISFDPRGIGATTPFLYCWPSKQSEQLWSMQDVGVIDSHQGLLYDAYARAAASSNICTSSLGGNITSGIYETLSYVSTTSVARDMLEILHKTGEQKLRYWGFSYGTMLGGMFATMYPDKIERMVNDGNVDYTEWTSFSHASFLHDTDNVMSSFYSFCHTAGPTKCALYSSSPAEISKRMDDLLQSLKLRPIAVPSSSTTDLPELVTYSSLKRLISTALYRPIDLFPALARVCSALEKGNGVPFVDLATAYGMRKRFSCDCEGCGVPPPATGDEPEGNDDAFRAIMCSDGEALGDNVEEFERYANSLMRLSKSAGAVNVLFKIACAGWKARAKWRFAGPFEANTSNPVLFIANRADNVTPLRSARANAKGFEGSVILIQNSFGHTSLAAPSTCTASHVRAYFQDGILPAVDTECEADIQPFQGENEVLGMGAGEENAEMRAALWELMENMPHVPFGRF